MHVRVDPLVEPEVLKFCAQARQPFCLFRLCAEFTEIEKLAERLVAGKPDFLVEDIRIDWCCCKLQVNTRIFTERRVIDQLRERMQVAGSLRADDNTQSFRCACP